MVNISSADASLIGADIYFKVHAGHYPNVVFDINSDACLGELLNMDQIQNSTYIEGLATRSYEE